MSNSIINEEDPMFSWKKIAISCLVLLATNAAVHADEAKNNTENKKVKHMVDMADGLNSQEFMDTKDPDALWSSTMYVPWKRTGAIDAYSDAGKSSSAATNGSGIKEENLAMPKKSGEITGLVDGKKIDSDQLVNIRVLYGLD